MVPSHKEVEIIPLIKSQIKVQTISTLRDDIKLLMKTYGKRTVVAKITKDHVSNNKIIDENQGKTFNINNISAKLYASECFLVCNPLLKDGFGNVIKMNSLCLLRELEEIQKNVGDAKIFVEINGELMNIVDISFDVFGQNYEIVCC